MKFNAKKSTGHLMNDGDHKVMITSVMETESKGGTKQLEVDFRNVDGQKIKAWYSLEGFEKSPDGSYAYDEDGERINSEANTNKALEILGELGVNAGLEGEADTDDLVGATVGIHVITNAMGNKRVRYSFDPSGIEEYEQA